MAVSIDSDQLDKKDLEKLLKALKKIPKLKVGVLGGNAKNATIGAVHEFGSPARNIPQRSFLRIPIAENLERELEQSGLLDKESLKEVIKTQSLLPYITKIGIAAVAVVDDAFETSGNGKWPKWKDPNYMNQGGMLLVDTGQLRDSIIYEVKS